MTEYHRNPARLKKIHLLQSHAADACVIPLARPQMLAGDPGRTTPQKNLDGRHSAVSTPSATITTLSEIDHGNITLEPIARLSTQYHFNENSRSAARLP